MEEENEVTLAEEKSKAMELIRRTLAGDSKAMNLLKKIKSTDLESIIASPVLDDFLEIRGGRAYFARCCSIQPEESDIKKCWLLYEKVGTWNGSANSQEMQECLNNLVSPKMRVLKNDVIQQIETQINNDPANCFKNFITLKQEAYKFLQLQMFEQHLTNELRRDLRRPFRRLKRWFGCDN